MTGFNWVDWALLALVALVAWEATRRGFLQVFAGLCGFALSLGTALLFTLPVAAWLAAHTSLPQPWTAPAAFFLLWLGTQILYLTVSRILLGRSLYRAALSPLNRWLALLPGAGQGFLVGSLLVTLLVLAPLPGLPHQAIVDSALGGRLVTATLALERPLEGIFGPALRQTLGFLTVKPEVEAGETVQLKFEVSTPAPDQHAEEEMLGMLNAARNKAGLPSLEMDPSLRDLARAHGADMLRQGYFSHTGRDGRSPFDRMRDAHIVYTSAGENLALAISTQQANQGLMDSAGHRANILSLAFRRVGIGAMDGGIYGKIFVQEFTD